MPILDVKCRHCSTEIELIVCQHRDSHGLLPSERAHFLRCQSKSCKGKMRRFYVVERHYPAALKFVDGVSQWESNEKKAKALREGKH